jgi:uncharacterized protein
MDPLQYVHTPKSVAVVGLSDNPYRPSYEVAEYLLEHGFTVIPVNPTITEVLGLTSYPSVSAIPKDIHIDIVDIFRRPESVPDVVHDVIRSGRRPTIWMQEGVVSEEARQLAQDHGMEVLMDLCLMKTHKRKRAGE